MYIVVYMEQGMEEERSMCVWGGVDLHVHFICSLLVTNSSSTLITPGSKTASFLEKAFMYSWNDESSGSSSSFSWWVLTCIQV